MKNSLKDLKNKNIHVVGAFGAEGSVILEFLSKSGIKNITIHDFSVDVDELRKNFFNTHLWIKKTERLEAFEKLLRMPAKMNLKDKYLDGVLEADIIFTPSSWYLYKPNFPVLDEARKKGIAMSSITKLYFELAKGKIISVTGTKGKGTTSKLIYEILSGSKKSQNVYLAGNDRRSGQELEAVSKMAKKDVLILETSNRQLMTDLLRSPDIGVITNISPDHIDEHGSYKNYIEVKKSLFKYSQKTDIAILNYDNKVTRKIGEELSKRKVGVYFFSRRDKMKKGAYVENGKIYIKIKRGKEYICDLSDIKVIGEHNIENVLAAVLAGYLAGAKPKAIKVAVQNFRGLHHRIEFVGEYGGAKFYDDTASTNPESTIAATKALNESRIMNQGSRIILIGGGDDKGMNYAGLAKVVFEKVDMLILLPGTGTDKFISQFQISNAKFQNNSKISNLKIPKKTNILRCGDFLEALNFININKKAGDTVLVSPACAHFQARYIDKTGKSLRRLVAENFAKI